MPGLDALAVGGLGPDGKGVTDPRDARHAVGGLLAIQGPTALDIRTGVLVGPGSTALITGTSKTGPKMSVLIGVHVAVGSRGAASGPYLGPTLDAPLEVDVELAPQSGSRIDVVYVKQRDGQSGIPSPDTSTGPLYGVLTGQASTGTPQKQDLSTIAGATELGTVQVSAGATSTNGSGVTIKNSARQTTTRGGRIPVANRIERVALTGFPGVAVLQLDKAWSLFHDGTRWRFEGDRVIVANANERADILSPDVYAGLIAHESDTGRQYVWNPALGSSGLWDQIGGPPETYAMASLTGAYKLIPSGGSYRPLTICKRGRECWFEGQIAQSGGVATGANGNSQFGSLPDAVTPSAGVQGPVGFYTGSGAAFAAAIALVLPDNSAYVNTTVGSSAGWSYDLTGLRWRTNK